MSEPTTEPTPDEPIAVDEAPLVEASPRFELIPIEVLDERPGANPPKFYILGSDLVAQTDEGQLTLSLRIKSKNADKFDNIEGRRKRLDAILEANNQKAVSKTLDELDVIDTGEIVQKWYQAWDQRNEARLGESFRSLSS